MPYSSSFKISFVNNSKNLTCLIWFHVHLILVVGCHLVILPYSTHLQNFLNKFSLNGLLCSVWHSLGVGLDNLGVSKDLLCHWCLFHARYTKIPWMTLKRIKYNIKEFCCVGDLWCLRTTQWKSIYLHRNLASPNRMMFKVEMSLNLRETILIKIHLCSLNNWQ